MERKCGVIYLYPQQVFTRHLNMECLELAVPANFVSYAPTFFSFIFLKNLVVSGFSLHEFQIYFGCVFQQRIFCIILKNGEITQRTKQLFFWGFLWLKICPNIKDCPLNKSLNPRYLSMSYDVLWLSGIASVLLKSLI